MYQALRKIHLYAGLLVLLMVGMYAVTGGVMTHAWYFTRHTDKKTATETLDYHGDWTVAALAPYLQEHYDLPGRVTFSAADPGGQFRFAFATAGQQRSVVVPATHDTMSVTTSLLNVPEIMNQLHRLRGYGGGWAFAVWAFLYDLTCVGLVVFSFTGVYLWWKLTKRRALGYAFLGVSTAYTVGMYAYFLLIP